MENLSFSFSGNLLNQLLESAKKGDFFAMDLLASIANKLLACDAWIENVEAEESYKEVEKEIKEGIKKMYAMENNDIFRIIISINKMQNIVNKSIYFGI